MHRDRRLFLFVHMLSAPHTPSEPFVNSACMVVIKFLFMTLTFNSYLWLLLFREITVSHLQSSFRMADKGRDLSVGKSVLQILQKEL